GHRAAAHSRAKCIASRSDRGCVGASGFECGTASAACRTQHSGGCEAQGELASESKATRGAGHGDTPLVPVLRCPYAADLAVTPHPFSRALCQELSDEASLVIC